MLTPAIVAAPATSIEVGGGDPSTTGAIILGAIIGLAVGMILALALRDFAESNQQLPAQRRRDRAARRRMTSLKAAAIARAEANGTDWAVPAGWTRPDDSGQTARSGEPR